MHHQCHKLFIEVQDIIQSTPTIPSLPRHKVTSGTWHSPVFQASRFSYIINLLCAFTLEGMTQCRHCGLLPEDIVLGESDGTGDPQQELEELHPRIAQLEILLMHLKSKVVGLKKRINWHSSPILKLPPEVTIEIFEACLPVINWSMEDPTHCYRRIPNATIPLVISGVCNTWRNLAFSTPKLWRSISVQHDDCRSELDVEVLCEWISRSGSTPLSIHMWLSGNETALVDSILGIFADCCERWRDIYFTLPLHLYDIFDSIRGRLPLLTTLCLSLVDDTDMDFQHFSIAPRLRHVEIHRYRPGAMTIAFDQVEKLSLDNVDTTHCWEILNSCPVLSHCTLEHTFSRSHSRALPPLASQVKYLKLGMEGDSKLLESLCLPVMEELRIDTMRNELPHSSLISLMSRSGCSLQRFSLHRCRCGASNLQEFFSAIPSLVELEVTDSTFSDGPIFQTGLPRMGIFQILASTAVLPNLRVIKSVDPNDAADNSMSDLRNMALSRWRNATSSGRRTKGAQLSSVDVTISHWYYVQSQVGINTRVLAQLRQLIGEGLEISIKNRRGTVLLS
jgi:F-box-like